MTGGDLARSSIEEAKKNKKLKDVTLQELDLFELPENTYDIVVANALLYLLTRQEFKDALEIIYTSLREGGALFVFDLMHSFEQQDVVVYETSVGHPDGIRISFRPVRRVQETLVSLGFSDLRFYPFQMPFDLEVPKPDEDVVSYTVTSQEGERMTFRGVLFQPWCHMIAKKT
jgi:SAM-dependent methyltransferase